ncbi:MAG: Uma2 family endonuclease [Sulfuriferula sp.]
MSAEEFFDWLSELKKHELIDGETVLMAGANMRHNKITFSIGFAPGNQLKGQSCQPFGSDMVVKISSGNVCYPEIVVGYGKFDDKLMTTDQPALVIGGSRIQRGCLTARLNEP